MAGMRKNFAFVTFSTERNEANRYLIIPHTVVLNTENSKQKSLDIQ